ncbi:hypothetical protein EK21DRAFT_90042 [Setomelanomma holmii]|uniref:Uncharacterized protein n=1 Tax=Setomelanomma holmii TaxID=210430 RepID=A0A9P4LM00_9PLEO|nr:hypothetical protein EK21DRAFT_90042 [Setomelanomma holmii]
MRTQVSCVCGKTSVARSIPNATATPVPCVCLSTVGLDRRAALSCSVPTLHVCKHESLFDADQVACRGSEHASSGCFEVLGTSLPIDKYVGAFGWLLAERLQASGRHGARLFDVRTDRIARNFHFGSASVEIGDCRIPTVPWDEVGTGSLKIFVAVERQELVARRSMFAFAFLITESQERRNASRALRLVISEAISFVYIRPVTEKLDYADRNMVNLPVHGMQNSTR